VTFLEGWKRPQMPDVEGKEVAAERLEITLLKIQEL
jgi:hypothetical protein